MGNFSIQETLTYYQWVVTLELLEVGIPWNTIQEMTENQINIILGVVAAKRQKEQEEQAREMPEVTLSRALTALQERLDKLGIGEMGIEFRKHFLDKKGNMWIKCCCGSDNRPRVPIY